MTLSVAIPTYGRDQVLIESVAALLALDPPPFELLVVDQTPRHDPASEERLAAWQEEGRIRWLRLPTPSITGAMNRALQEACGDRVLFLDDDILPDSELLTAHERAGETTPDAMLAGRVLQPWHGGQSDPEDGPFLFNSLRPRSVEEFMGATWPSLAGRPWTWGGSTRTSFGWPTASRPSSPIAGAGPAIRSSTCRVP